MVNFIKEANLFRGLINEFMQLVIYCKKCSKRNALKVKGADRVELKMKYGDNVDVVCKYCKSKLKYSISEIVAEQRFSSLIFLVLFVVLSVLLVLFLWDYNWHNIGSVYLIPVGLAGLALVFATANKEITKKLRGFNQS